MTGRFSAAVFLLAALPLLGTAPRSRADDGIFPSAPAARSAIDFDGRGFLIHGKRTPIISAGLEYARIPRALWRDRLQRLQRAGFNCVEVYTFWNWHEPKEGQFDFSGDHDLDAFLKLVHQLGMYAICRVGPYYCAEWDGGGYPVWLRFQPGVSVREDNPQFEADVDRFFGRLIPIVAANQIDHGGSVVMVQLENEHPAGWGKEIPNAYFAHLRDRAVALGLEVPYFFSGLHHSSDPAGDRSWDSAGRSNPWFSTEFWSVWYDHYGPNPNDADDYERRTWKIWAYGGNGYNYYMAHGGTNFGYTNNNEDAASYDYGAAVGQAGDLRPLYYRFKRIAWFARSFPEILEDSVNADGAFQGAATEPSVRVTARKSPGGTMVFLDNPGKVSVKTQIRGPDGLAYPAAGPMTLGPGQILPVVEDAPLTPHITLALGAARILGTASQGGATTLVVYGPAGDPGQLSFTAPSGAKTQGAGGVWTQTPSGRADLALTFPADRPAEYRLTSGAESVRVLAMSDAMADHTWFIPTASGTDIVCGPAYVGNADVVKGHLRLTTEKGLAAANGIAPYPYAEASPVLIYGPDGDGVALTPETPMPISPAVPRLSGWTAKTITEEAPDFSDKGWMTSADPLPMGADGDASAYAWYRTTVQVPAAGTYALTFQGANDRVFPFLDGVRVPDTNVHHDAIDLTLTPGRHSVAILAAQYGRDKLFGYIGTLTTINAKGLVGPARLRIANGPGVALTDWRVAAADGDHTVPPPSAAPGWVVIPAQADYFHGRRGFAWYQTTLPAVNAAGRPQVLHFESVDDNATVFVNGRQVAHHEGWSEAFDVPIPAPLGNGSAIVVSVLVQNTDGAGGITGPATLLSYRSDAPVIGWKMRGGIEAGLSPDGWKPLPAGGIVDETPRYFRAHFSAIPPAVTGPHPIWRLQTHGLSAGFVWLNGHNLGRYPEKIPVDGLYLPECWLRPGDNTIMIFDEEGKRPDGVALAVEAAASRDVRSL
jgi:beta-galactosidase